MKITPKVIETTKTFKTTSVKNNSPVKNRFDWWTGKDEKSMCDQMLTTAVFLKDSQIYRQRQIAIFAKLYGNQSLFNFIGTNIKKLSNSTSLPYDRPTFNLIQSCVDTVVARIGQNKPSPVFLTDGSDYRQRNLAKKLNNFIAGEFYQTKLYEKSVIALRDCLVDGEGAVHIYKDNNNKVAIERVMVGEIFVDENEAMYGEPRQMYRVKLVDRHVLIGLVPDAKTKILNAEQAFPDEQVDASKTVSDQVLVVEAWHLPSGPNANDGKHVIAVSSGLILNEKYEKETFPFVFMHFSPRLLGYWSQGLAEQLMGTQLEINSILYTISKSMKLVGVPRVFVEAASKVSDAYFNDSIGAIIHYKGIKPDIEVFPCVAPELYTHLQTLIQYGYQQSGISQLQASAQKPEGLDSGQAIRTYEDISTDRLATISKRYDDFFIEVAYQVLDLAIEIAKEEGNYETVFPDRDGAREVSLPEVKSITENPYVIQCFNQSSLPKDPAGRMAKVTEMIQAGMISIKEGRRLLDYPDLGQIEKLANAGEERIYKILDTIIEDGAYQPPDPFMDLQLANDTAVSYYNLYSMANLEEEKAQMLRDFYSQVQALKQEATMPAPQMAAPNSPQAQPQALPQSPLVPNAIQPAAA
jgi:hypothetical protein